MKYYQNRNVPLFLSINVSQYSKKVNYYPVHPLEFRNRSGTGYSTMKWKLTNWHVIISFWKKYWWIGKIRSLTTKLHSTFHQYIKGCSKWAWIEILYYKNHVATVRRHFKSDEPDWLLNCHFIWNMTILDKNIERLPNHDSLKNSCTEIYYCTPNDANNTIGL